MPKVYQPLVLLFICDCLGSVTGSLTWEVNIADTSTALFQIHKPFASAELSLLSELSVLLSDDPLVQQAATEMKGDSGQR